MDIESLTMDMVPDVHPNEIWTERRSGGVPHPDDARTAFEMDYARIVHSSSFRRLQGKTQILALGDDDFYRTRLTHSLEVAQVAGGIVQSLRRHSDAVVRSLVTADGLVPAIGLAHDLGHPPFGHGGEQALNSRMQEDGGYEGNAQTLRILARLECFSPSHGADLTRRSMLGILKYPSARRAAIDGRTSVTKPVKAYYDLDGPIVDWILLPFDATDRDRFVELADVGSGPARTTHKSFDCSVMDVADDIAYGVHDLEDAIALGLVERDGLATALHPEVCAEFLRSLEDRPLDGGSDHEALIGSLFGDEGARKRAIGRLVHHFIRSCSVRDDEGFLHPLLSRRVVLAPGSRALLDALQKLVVRDVIDAARVQQLEYKGRRMVTEVFDALLTDPRRLLPRDAFARYEKEGRRALCDYLAAMADGTLLKTYERLFSPRMGSVFDRF